jgi:hypothetical protein
MILETDIAVLRKVRYVVGLQPSEFSGFVSCQSYLIFLRKAID